MKKKTPKRKELSKSEAAVCRRLRQAREHLRLTQEEFANQIPINRQRLASYEELRAPLRFDLALRICRQFIIGEKWLATGKGDMRTVMDLISEPICRQIEIDTPFGEAYSKFLAERFEQLDKENEGQIRILPQEGDNLEFTKNLFNYVIPVWCSMLKENEVPAFLIELLKVGLRLLDVKKETGQLPRAVLLQEKPE